MTATEARPFTPLLTDALATLNLRATSVQTWEEPDNPPDRPGPRLHFQVRLRQDPARIYSGCRDLGWDGEGEMVAWIADRVLEMTVRAGSYGHMDKGLDEDYRQVRAGFDVGVGPRLKWAQMAQTGRTE